MSETTTNRTNQSATTATLAGYEIPRLGMGTMALAIEGAPPTVIRRSRPSMPRSMPESVIWTRLGLIICPAHPEPASRRIWAMANIWSAMLCTRGMGRENRCSWPPKPVGCVRLTAAATTLAGRCRPETMIANAKESASRLGVDTLDLLYSHCNDPQVPYEDQMGALKQLVDEGVAKAVGTSRIDNADIETARNILGDLSWPSRTSSPRSTATLNTRWKLRKARFGFCLLVATRRIPRPVQRASVRPVPRSRQDSRLLLPARHARVGTCAIPISVHDSLGQKPAGDSGLVQSQRTEIVRQ